jgi:beta-ureidopropionase / N-carbamoyl-L-amino-acid hydrolase
MQHLKTSILICFLTILAYTTFSQITTNGKELKVNQQRIEKRIFELSKFGKDSLDRGYRVAFTKGYVEGRAWFIDQMKKAGLEVTIDYAGNIIGKRKGRNTSLKPIAFGSHIDMVPDGGNYDGRVGAVGGLEVVETLKENNVVTNHPLELIITSDEEGSMVGSQSLSGNFTVHELKNVSQSGLTVVKVLKLSEEIPIA